MRYACLFDQDMLHLAQLRVRFCAWPFAGQARSSKKPRLDIESGVVRLLQCCVQRLVQMHHRDSSHSAYAAGTRQLPRFDRPWLICCC
jgi:hypothetical protein